MATHSTTLAWKIPWTEEPGGLQSMGHDWATSLSLSTFHFDALEKEMATHSSVLAWRIPGMAEPGELPSTGSHRVGHDWSDLAAAFRISVLQVVIDLGHSSEDPESSPPGHQETFSFYSFNVVTKKTKIPHVAPIIFLWNYATLEIYNISRKKIMLPDRC